MSESAVFGGGCFWCVEACFKEVEGVESVVSGYAGGDTEDPSYREVCSGGTGHAEVVKVVFDPGKVSYRKLLEVFFRIHDPTTLDRQGLDIGEQYRSIILYADREQREAAVEVMKEVQESLEDRIVTELRPLEKFYRAEDEHQDYFEKNPDSAYCRLNIPPKLEKVKKSGFSEEE